MKTVGKLVWIALFMLALPLAAAAGEMQHMDQKGGMQGMEHGQMNGSMEGGMMNGMVMLGNQTEDGVKAMAHIKDISEAMAKMGMDKTNHLMIMFTDANTGKAIEKGSAAVKIKDPAGNVSEPIMLMGMPGGFGSDITLTEKGKYEFIVGTKLADGKKRQYRFDYTVE